MAEEDDGRPESSPFESASTEVYFDNGSKFIVPSSLFLNNPKLRQGERRPPRSIRLDDATPAVGHVIFYYLLTDTYQCLRPKGNSQHERLVNELATGVGVYNASRKYDLLALQETAKEEIQQLAQQLPFPLVLNLLRDLHLDPNASETWLDEYVQSGLKSLFRTPTAFLDYTSPQVEQDVISFSNIILKNLANLLANDAAQPRTDYAGTPTLSPEPGVIEEESPRDLEPIPEAEPLPEPAEPTPSEAVQESSSIPAPPPEPELEPIAAEQPVPIEEVETVPVEKLREVPAEEVLYEAAPAPVPEPEPDVVREVSGRSFWDDFIAKPEDKPPQHEPEPSAVAEPAAEPIEVEVQYSPPRAEYLDVEQVPEASPEAPPAAPHEDLSSLAPSKASIKDKKKKRLSIFRTEDSPTPEPKVESDEAPTPAPEPEVKPPEEVSSQATSSGTKTKKKKKRSLFRTETAP